VIVVDTSVWIDFFRDIDAPHVAALAELIRHDAGLAFTDIVLAELLQGARDDRDAARIERRLSSHELFELDRADDAGRAGSMYRAARASGHTIRRTLDCLIASVCVRESVAVMHADADFDRLALGTDLQVYRPWPPQAA
jgi:predicted nucleic acid-binding protein